MSYAYDYRYGYRGGRARGGGFDPSPYPFSTAKFNGDSRTASVGGYINNGTSLSLTIGLASSAMTGIIQPLAGNPFLLRQGFNHAIGGSSTRATGMTFSGAATGKRYDVATNGVINTNGGGASYFPGNVSGTSATGGQYV